MTRTKLDSVLGIKTCKVGMFQLPGVVFDKDQLTPEKVAEMDQWAAAPGGVGKRLTEVLWSFKNESQRDWFILKWCDDFTSKD